MAGKDRKPDSSGQVLPGLIRIVAPNPGPMTHTGTCTYLLGDRQIGVIDPGPDDPAHLRAILDAVPSGAAITEILVTHAHRDHCGLAHRLSDRTGASVLAGPPPLLDGRSPGDAGIQADFRPDVMIEGGQMIGNASWQVEALATPGHLSGHFSFVWKERSAIFTGDHVMGWASTFISPPHGSLAQYRASLDLLIARPETLFLPGHGPSIADGPARARALKAHRQMREDQIVAALATGPATAAALTARIYEDTPVEMHPAARRNVLAHLLDLETRRIAVSNGEAAEGALYQLRQ